MGKKFFVSLFLFVMILITLVSNLKLFGQFTAEELADRPRWEEFLKRAKIVKADDIGQGVTKPKRLLLKDGDLEQSAVWRFDSHRPFPLFQF